MEAVAVDQGFAPDFVEPPGAAAWLAKQRRDAFARFEQLGFPTPKNEEWRYTGIQPITSTRWAPAGAARGPVSLPSPDRPRVVFVNGRFAKELSRPPRGVRVESLREILEREPEALQKHLSKIATFDTSAFAALNTALFEDGAVVSIAKGSIVAEPIHLIFLSAPADEPTVSYPRILIFAGERSQASVVETYSGVARSLTVAVTEVVLSAGAMLEHSKLQQESRDACHVHTIGARLGRSSHFTSHNIALGGALARTDLRVELAAEGAECTLNGLFAGQGNQHLDNFTVIDHARPHGVSRELYKGIMDGSSRGVFHGKIIVRPDAQKTDAIQTNKNLLLSRHALVNSTPALEIFADDVKCKHGSTTGQLDAAALFYLRSRGIGETQARTLLTYAFAADVVERISIPWIRETVERELGVRLGGAAGGTFR